MSYSDTAVIEKSVMSDVVPSFETIVLEVQSADDTMCTSSFVERGPLRLGTESMIYGTRMIGNPPTHVAGFTRMPNGFGNHYYVAKG
jgi:acyl-[acyl carrier protein]--UDP-N-acetylglucosamine O-acyltransferase